MLMPNRGHKQSLFISQAYRLSLDISVWNLPPLAKKSLQARLGHARLLGAWNQKETASRAKRGSAMLQKYANKQSCKNMPTTKEQVKAAIEVVLAIANAIRELREVPSG